MQSFLIQNNTQMTPEQKRQAIAKNFAQQIMGQPAQSVEQGAAQLATGIGMGLANYRDPTNQFPVQPADPNTGNVETPSLATRFGNLFAFGNNGGLR